MGVCIAQVNSMLWWLVCVLLTLAVVLRRLPLAFLVAFLEAARTAALLAPRLAAAAGERVRVASHASARTSSIFAQWRWGRSSLV